MICNLSAVPLLVVTNTTPFAPRTPYTAVAEASFNIEKLSTSDGSISLKLPSKPSINTRALLLAPNVPIPRIQNSEIFFPGSPLRCNEIIPGIRPPNILLILVAGVCISAISTFVIAPTTLALRCVPIPTMTVSSSTCESCFNLITTLLSCLVTKYSSCL